MGNTDRPFAWLMLGGLVSTSRLSARAAGTAAGRRVDVGPWLLGEEV